MMRKAVGPSRKVSVRFKVFIAVVFSVVISIIGVYDFLLGDPPPIPVVRAPHNLTPDAANRYSNDSSVNLSSVPPNALCPRILSVVDMSSWPKVVYHKDRNPNLERDKNFDTAYLSSLKEDDKQARETIDEFNKIQASVLTPHLIDSGLTLGEAYPAYAFAKRLMGSSLSDGTTQPLHIAVFGSSFTTGSNCGESSSQESWDCAWPERLTRRWEELLANSSLFPSASVKWRHFEENAQNSANIAQKLPAIIDEYHSKNASPDVILLDNTITDVGSDQFAWFEASVRVLVKSFPGAVIISLVDAIPMLVDHTGHHEIAFCGRLKQVQQHYGLTVINFARMAEILHSNKILIDSLNDTVDLLWPQSTYMISSKGTKLMDEETAQSDDPMYWANFVPTTRKTKHAFYPDNHPPWATHQYVADSVMHALLKTMQKGLGCDNDDRYMPSVPFLPSLPNATIATKVEMDNCVICLYPLTRIDARMIKSIGHAHSTDDGIIESKNNNDDVVVTCGDWKWVTDRRNRSGWQSEKYGSIIRFRLKVSDEPTIALTHMRSYEKFGDLRVTFRVLTKQDDFLPPLGCNDIDRLENSTLIPSLVLGGSIPKFSLWETIVFPARITYDDVNGKPRWELLNQTVLSRMSSDVEHVDLYVENMNKNHINRIKIQTVTSC